MDDNFQKQQQLVVDHMKTALEVIEAYNKIVELGEACLKLSNYMINYMKITIAFLDAEISKIFR